MKPFQDKQYFEKVKGGLYGLWAVDGVVFDVGIQTSAALEAYKAGMEPKACGILTERETAR